MKEDGNQNRGFFIRWVVLCGLGFGGGLAVALGLSAPIEAIVGMMLVTPIIFVLAGSMLGAMQWLAFWRNVRAGALWVGASALGFGVGITIGVVSVEFLGRAVTGEQVRLATVGPFGRLLALILVGTLTGLAVGIAQRIALRAYSVARGPWTVWCVLGFGVGLPIGGLAADLVAGGLASISGFAVFLGVAGAMVGALTAKNARQIAGRLATCRPAGA